MAALDTYAMAEHEDDGYPLIVEKCLMSAPAADVVAALAVLVMHYRSRAASAEGRIEGQALTIDYLKHRVKALEALKADGPEATS